MDYADSKKHRGTKRQRRIENKISAGIKTPPEIVKTVKNYGVGDWTCNSTTTDNIHYISMETNKETLKTYFTCTCNKDTVHCKHINAVLMKIVLDHSDHAGITKDVDDLSLLMTNFCF